jgi:hypothetical protein
MSSWTIANRIPDDTQIDGYSGARARSPRRRRRSRNKRIVADTDPNVDECLIEIGDWMRLEVPRSASAFVAGHTGLVGFAIVRRLEADPSIRVVAHKRRAVVYSEARLLFDTSSPMAHRAKPWM